jgi:hypothetical protein
MSVLILSIDFHLQRIATKWRVFQRQQILAAAFYSSSFDKEGLRNWI